jgi:hypothetical protein
MAIISKTKWAYVAAMVDGEGHISIAGTKSGQGYKGKPYWLIDCKIGISNTSVELMKWLKENFGGEYHDGGQGSRRICYRWNLQNYKQMEKFVLAILPYMVIKRKQALLALEFFRMFGQKNPAKRLELARRCQALNRGITPETNTPNPVLEPVKIESELTSDSKSAAVVILPDNVDFKVRYLTAENSVA